jgi:hypothetical protein|tara:strand:- start:2772 stop:3626 length:855 start_codon:yes stop_codon:yes gene_type:complete
VLGEVVFNTSLTGYQEILTDPSYAGQFVLFTCPEIGNVGINAGDMESTKAHMGGMLVRHLSLSVSNYRATMDLSTYLEQQNVVGISDIDTRAITRRLRDTGCLNGVITTDSAKTDEELVTMCKAWTIVGKDMISEGTRVTAFPNQAAHCFVSNAPVTVPTDYPSLFRPITPPCCPRIVQYARPTRARQINVNPGPLFPTLSHEQGNVRVVRSHGRGVGVVGSRENVHRERPVPRRVLRLWHQTEHHAPAEELRVPFNRGAREHARGGRAGHGTRRGASKSRHTA